MHPSFDLNSHFSLIIYSHNNSEHGSSIPSTHFHIPELDKLFPFSIPPILELISPPTPHHPPGAGKTSLLYMIIAHALLPITYSSSIPLPGHASAVILFDPLSHFSITRLTQVMLTIILTTLRTHNKPIDTTTKKEIKNMTSRSLLHIHIFRPSSFDSLLSTLRTLQTYLFNSKNHKSIHRRIHSVILEDLDTFAPAIRNNHSATTSSTSAVTSSSTNPLTTASTLLTSTLTRLSTLLSCIIITTSHSSSPSIYQSIIPNSWPSSISPTRVTKMAIRRIEVLKFAAASSAQQVEGQRAQRWGVVSRGRFEVWKVGGSMKDGERFVIRVNGEDVRVERDEGD